MDIAEQLLSRRYALTLLANESNVHILLRIASLQKPLKNKRLDRNWQLYANALQYEFNRRRLDRAAI